MKILKREFYESHLLFVSRVNEVLDKEKEVWIPTTELSSFIDKSFSLPIDKIYKIYYSPNYIYCRIHLAINLTDELNEKNKDTQLKFNFNEKTTQKNL